MAPSTKTQRVPPIATDLESLLAVEEQIERKLAEARECAARLVEDARARADSARHILTGELERERNALCADAAARARADIARLEGEAAAQLARYQAIAGERLAPVAEHLCELLARALVGEELP